MSGASPDERITCECVLVGGGHAHVQVLRRFMMQPLAGVRLTVVLDRPSAVYSGMVPGLVAGELEMADLEIDVVPLARRAGARVVLAPAVSIDPEAQEIHCEDRPPLRYDFASLDVGSSVRGLDLPGVRENALATRPIRHFVDALEARLRVPPERIVVVGAGAAGIELAFTIEARLSRVGAVSVSVFVVTERNEILPGASAAMRRAAHAELDARGIELVSGSGVASVEAAAVALADGRRIDSQLTVWATGAAPIPGLSAAALPQDEAGFIRVRDTLQVEGHDALFAVGDCAALASCPGLPKAGVYAVREGPVLDANLRAAISGAALRRYRPQRDFLSLLNLGGGRALGGKWGIAARGRFMHELKDRIDRRFMRRFQVLAPDGADAPGFPTPESMGMEEMPCGGCAAKVAATPLSRALARLPKAPDDPSVVLGLDTPDDAAAVRGPAGDITIASIDGFRAFADDPFLVGRVAAVNALNDVWVKGGIPRHALALVNVPEEDPDRAEELLFQVLAGVRRALDAEGVTLLGGHTTQGDDLFVALSVSGGLPDGAALLPASGAVPGCALVLTRALGTGVVLAADMQGRAPGHVVRQAHLGMQRSGRAAADLAREFGALAATDVSGFGFAGHLLELVQASRVSAELELATVPLLPGAADLLRRGLRSSTHEQNERIRRGFAIPADAHGDPRLAALFDPQTAGGLLVALPAAQAGPFVAALRSAGEPDAVQVGRVNAPRTDGALVSIRTHATQVKGADAAL